MDQALLRIFVAFLSCVVVVGCGSDDGSKEDEVAEDASVADSGDDEPPAARGGTGGRGGRGGSGGTAGGGTAGRGGTGGSGNAPTSCDDVDCKEPATCSVKDGRATCSCPDGYDDPNGDGSECKDRDECANADDNDCGARAKCENKPGGYECKCEGPAYQGDGKTCSCAEGYSEVEGFCVGDDGKACGDDLDCKNGNCESGICCAVACNTPDGECKTAKGATCKDGKTCEYPVSPDGDECDDGNACLKGSTCKAGACIIGTEPETCDDANPCTDDSCDQTVGCRNQNNTASCDDGNACTSGDVCANGSCAGPTTRDCSGSADDCNTGVCNPATGECGKSPIADGTDCDDESTCTTTDVCNAGTCTGMGNACGPNASACTPGTPNDCTCNAMYLESAGRCIPENDECEADPCDPNATCFDPSNNDGDVTCTCDPGFEGNGRECVQTDPCATNPCGEGRGTCAETTAGQYACTCADGFREVDGTCVCDLSGTFAVQATFQLAWSNTDGIEDGSATTNSWSIARYSYLDDGTLQMESVECGATDVDLCGEGGALLGREAYAQYGDIKSVGTASAIRTRTTIELPSAPLPDAAFSTPQYAVLSGISLTDPLGEWPTSRRNVQGSSEFSGTATNGARWIDSDNDQLIGMTTYTVGPGGISNQGDGPRPLQSYGERSEVCPRSNPSGERYAYAYPPAADGLAIRRIKRFYSANRVVQAYRGQIDSCDQISGAVTGPVNNNIRIETVIGGCIRDNNGGDAPCSAGVLDFVSGPEQSQDTQSGSFVMRRAADNVTCAQVRATDFD